MDVADKKKQRTTDERGQPRIFFEKKQKKIGQGTHAKLDCKRLTP